MFVDVRSSNGSLLHPRGSSINQSTFQDNPFLCFYSQMGIALFGSFNIVNAILFPLLSVFIFYYGFQQWKCSTSLQKISHSDFFTYHIVTMELIGSLGSVLCCCGIYSHQDKLLLTGLHIFTFKCFGQLLFHVLTCLERYVAVVHPIIYMNLRSKRGVQARNMVLCCVWLLCLAGAFSIFMEDIFIPLNFCLLASSLFMTTFCNISVVYVLVRPGPGDQARGRERAGQSKLRALHTMVAIQAVLMLRFLWALVGALLYASGKGLNCETVTSDVWFNLPSSLVLPLLFLHRAGKLACCTNNSK